MAFTKETARISGSKSKRGAGKLTKETKEIFIDILNANKSNINLWLKETAKDSPSKALELLLKISSFVLPKPKAIDISLNDTKNDLSQLTDEELEEQLYQSDRILYPETYKQRRLERLNITPIEFISTKKQ